MHVSDYKFTERQQEILRGAVLGQESPDICKSQGISKTTLSREFMAICHETGAKNKPALVAMFQGAEFPPAPPRPPEGFLGTLSTKKREILRLVAEEKTNVEIAAQTGMSKPGVAHAISALFEVIKELTGIRPKNRRDLVTAALAASKNGDTDTALVVAPESIEPQPITVDKPKGVTMLTPPFLQNLSPEEREVANLIVEGKSNKIIAEELGIAEPLARKHTKNISEKVFEATGERPLNHLALIGTLYHAIDNEIEDKKHLTVAAQKAVTQNAWREAAAEIVKAIRTNRHEEIGEITLALREKLNPAAIRIDLRDSDSLLKQETWRRIESADSTLGIDVYKTALKLTAGIHEIRPETPYGAKIKNLLRDPVVKG